MSGIFTCDTLWQLVEIQERSFWIYSSQLFGDSKLPIACYGCIKDFTFHYIIRWGWHLVLNRKSIQTSATQLFFLHPFPSISNNLDYVIIYNSNALWANAFDLYLPPTGSFYSQTRYPILTDVVWYQNRLFSRAKNCLSNQMIWGMKFTGLFLTDRLTTHNPDALHWSKVNECIQNKNNYSHFLIVLEDFFIALVLVDSLLALNYNVSINDIKGELNLCVFPKKSFLFSMRSARI